MRFSQKEVEAEIREKERDLDAFRVAALAVRNRVREVKDSESRLTPLAHWAGTAAVMGSLDLAIHAMERTLAELYALRDSPEAANEQPN